MPLPAAVPTSSYCLRLPALSLIAFTIEVAVSTATPTPAVEVPILPAVVKFLNPPAE